MGLIMRRNLMAAKSGPTAKDYVQDGLIAMWDGIENAGWGVHDPNATVWKDLVDNIELTVLNGTWIDDGVQLNGGRIYNSSIKSLVDAVSSGEFTIEYVGLFDVRDGIGYGNESAGFKIGGHHSGFWTGTTTSMYGSTFYSKKNLSSLSVVQTYPVYYETNFGWDDSMQNHPSPSTPQGMRADLQAGIGVRKCCSQFLSHEWECKSYVDSVFYNAAMVNSEANFKRYGFILGSYIDDRSFMTYNAFRCYNRPLTAAEIAANYAIDKARFNLT